MLVAKALEVLTDSDRVLGASDEPALAVWRIPETWGLPEMIHRPPTNGIMMAWRSGRLL